MLPEAQVQEEVETVQRQPRDHKDDHHADEQVQGSIPAATAASQQPAAGWAAAAAAISDGHWQRYSARRQVDGRRAVLRCLRPPRPKNEAAAAAAAHFDGEAGSGDGEASAAMAGVLWRRRRQRQAVALRLVPERQRGQAAVDPKKAHFLDKYLKHKSRI